MKGKKISFSHAGNHHNAQLDYDASNKKVKGGIITNFSSNAAAALSINGNGKVSGTLVHSGDTHSLRMKVNSDGSFEGCYKDEKGLEIKISKGGNLRVKGNIPKAGIAIKGEHHVTRIGLTSKGKISGHFESKICKDGKFRI